MVNLSNEVMGQRVALQELKTGLNPNMEFKTGVKVFKSGPKEFKTGVNPNLNGQVRLMELMS